MSPELNKEFVQFIIHYTVNYLSLIRKDIKFIHLRRAYEHPPTIARSKKSDIGKQQYFSNISSKNARERL